MDDLFNMMEQPKQDTPILSVKVVPTAPGSISTFISNPDKSVILTVLPSENTVAVLANAFSPFSVLLTCASTPTAFISFTATTP